MWHGSFFREIYKSHQRDNLLVKRLETNVSCLCSNTYVHLVLVHQLSHLSLGGSVVNSLPAVQETLVQSLGREDPLEKGMATHFSILAWRIPWTEEPSELQSMGLQRVRHDWVTNIFTFWSWFRGDTSSVSYWIPPAWQVSQLHFLLLGH